MGDVPSWVSGGTMAPNLNRILLRLGAASAGLVVVCAFSLFARVPGVSAHISPANCNANNLVLNFSKDKTIVRPGDTIHYTVNVTNDPTVPSPTPCDVTNANVTLTLPAMDGTPTGTVITLASGASFP